MLDEVFNEEYLKNYYFGSIRSKIHISGNDRINRLNFERHLIDNLSVISRKWQNCSYRFTPYKGVLISKGYDKLPRIIAIAGIRDRIVLGILKELLFLYYSDIKLELVQTKIQSIKSCIGDFDTCIKIDISDFFGSIEHALLKSKLQQHILDDRVINLIFNAINTPTTNENFKDNRINKLHRGIPQGIAISNVLAEIYFREIDVKYSSLQCLKYFRYVDDILILCNAEIATDILGRINGDMEQLKLELNKEKTKSYSLINEFTYLGYSIRNKSFSVRKTSILRYERIIESLFIEYTKNKDMSVDELVWKLNLKITGFMFENKKYGWIFFFSQIDDLEVLAHLDNFVLKLFSRFKIKLEDSLNPTKKYLRAFHEIIYKLNNTSYIPNFSKYSIDEMREILNNIFKVNLDNLSEEDIMFEFSSKISNLAKNFERDVQNLS